MLVGRVLLFMWEEHRMHAQVKAFLRLRGSVTVLKQGCPACRAPIAGLRAPMRISVSIDTQNDHCVVCWKASFFAIGCALHVGAETEYTCTVASSILRSKGGDTFLPDCCHT